MPEAPIENALKRLTDALDAMEDALEHRLDGGVRVNELEVELQRLGLDRSRLAQSMDMAEARSARLEEANREVSTKLVAAMETIRAVIDGREG